MVCQHSPLSQGNFAGPIIKGARQVDLFPWTAPVEHSGPFLWWGFTIWFLILPPS